MTQTERYLELGLRLGRHEPELVDSYYGPAELRQQIDDEPLVGSGDLAARYARWFEEAAVPPESVERAVDAALALVRERTGQAIGLPEGEEVELEIVTGERWFGYAHYLGGFRTRISVNTDLSFPAGDLLWFAAHRGVSGPPPDAVISEGLAETGPELVLDGGAHGELAERLRPVGFEYDAEVGARVAEARRKLYAVPSNVAILLHERGASHREAWDYAA